MGIIRNINKIPQLRESIDCLRVAFDRHEDRLETILNELRDFLHEVPAPKESIAQKKELIKEIIGDPSNASQYELYQQAAAALLPSKDYQPRRKMYVAVVLDFLKHHPDKPFSVDELTRNIHLPHAYGNRGERGALTNVLSYLFIRQEIDRVRKGVYRYSQQER